MNELVKRLSTGRHPIAASRSRSASDLKESIDRGFVLLKFTDTQGGTELGVTLSRSQCSCDDANFEEAKGSVHLVGHLMLNYDKVELAADIDLSTLKGEGSLKLIAEEAEWRAQAAQESGSGAPVH